MVCSNFSNFFNKILLLEPEASTAQIEKIDSVTNQDGWLNALSLEKLTTTVYKIKKIFNL